MYYITSFYQFIQLSQDSIEKLKADLTSTFEGRMTGLILISSEGMNATVSADHQSIIESFKKLLGNYLPVKDIIFKESTSDKLPFRRFKISVREEIITYNGKSEVPHPSAKSFLSPEEWHRILKEEKDFVLIDTRNDYETLCGIFEGAIDPNIRTFTDFKKYYTANQLPKDKKVLLYCTGGVRCEKAVSDLEDQGYDNVYQLHGGILKYMEQYPDGYFKGECFVFDHRVSVNKDLQPSTVFSLCPHCGDPSTGSVDCIKCHKIATVCDKCLTKGLSKQSCSKNCAYWIENHKSSP